MSMKLSRRDRIIILVVLVAVVIGLGIALLLKPRYEDMQASADRLAAKQSERDELQEKIDSLPQKKQTLENKVDDVIKAQEKFLDEREYEPNYMLDNYVKALLEPAAGIQITGISAGAVSSSSLAEYKYNYNALAYDMKVNADLAHQLPDEVYYAYENNYPGIDQGAKLGRTTMTVSYTCAEPMAVYDAIDAVARCDKNIYLETCSANYDTEESINENGEVEIKGNLVISLYTLYPLNKDDIDKSV